MATINGYGHIVKYLVNEVGINVNQTNDFGQTALHLACDLGKLAIATFLVSSFANIDIRDAQGRTPYELCNTPEMMQLVGISIDLVISEKIKSRKKKVSLWSNDKGISANGNEEEDFDDYPHKRDGEGDGMELSYNGDHPHNNEERARGTSLDVSSDTDEKIAMQDQGSWTPNKSSRLQNLLPKGPLLPFTALKTLRRANPTPTSSNNVDATIFGFSPNESGKNGQNDNPQVNKDVRLSLANIYRSASRSSSRKNKGET